MAKSKKTPTKVAKTKKAVANSGGILTVDKAYFIRTVTMNWTGQVVRCDDRFVVLKDAAWIADSGRFSEAIAKGTLNEVEPVPGEVVVSLGALVDAVEWNHKLPREVK